MKRKIWKLVISIIIDILGALPTLFYVLGLWFLPYEVFIFLISVIYATIVGGITSIALYAMYGKTGYALLNFVENYIPFAQVFPTATLAWFMVKEK